VDDWRSVKDRWLPMRANIIWHLPDGDFCYGNGLTFEAAEFNLPPRPGADLPADQSLV
jgi:hypothetical protein